MGNANTNANAITANISEMKRGSNLSNASLAKNLSKSVKNSIGEALGVNNSNSNSQMKNLNTNKRVSSDLQQQDGLQRKHSKQALLPSSNANGQLKRPASQRTLLANEKQGRSRVISCGEAHIHHTEGEAAAMLAQFINDKVSESDSRVAQQGIEIKDIFCGPCQPKITVKDYLDRLIHYLTGIAQYERETGHDQDVRSDLAIRYLIMSLIYLNKLNQHSKVTVCSKNIHRLLITGITVASKIVDDIQPKNTYFAQLGGIPVDELNNLEREFCSLLGFHLSVTPEEFDNFYAVILSHDSAQSYEIPRMRQGSAAAA